MSTSLREQLQRLAVPQTTALADVRTRASILFDRKEAATKNRRTIYELGCSGLQELIALNSNFQQFQLTLFNEATVDLERAVEQSDINKLLDRNIRKFLQHLSPYFPLRPAHMCLEWLLRRFQIHEYNRADLLALSLPYHETNAFVRVLQTLRIRKNDAEWDWLRPMQKPGLPLPKSAIANRAGSNKAFFKFVCDSTLSTVRELGPRAHLLQAQLNFYATVVVGAWEHAAAIEEWHITTVLPSLLHALSSQTVDFVSAAFIIAAQLVRRTQLTPKLCNALLSRIAAVPYESLRSAAVLLFIWIFDTQQAAQAQFVLQTFIRLKWLTAQLAALVKDDNIAIHTLCVPLVQNCVAAIQTNHADAQLCKEFLERLLNDVSFPDATAQHIISCFLNSYVVAEKSTSSVDVKQLFDNDVIELDSDDEEMTDSSSDFQNWYSKCLHKLETQYPNAFDQTIKQALKSKQNNSTNLQQALKMALGYRLKSSDENATDLYGSLYHYNAQIRLCAIKELFANLNNYQRKAQNYQLLRECLADRLGDDSDLVVAEVLKLPTKDFINILGCEQFAAALFGILHKAETGDNAWCALTLQVVQHLCAEQLVQSYDANLILLALMPLLFPDNNLNITRDAIAIILQSALSKKIQFLQELSLPQTKKKQNDFNAIEFKKQFINITAASSATPDVLKLLESVAGNVNAQLFKNAKHFSHFLLLVTACLKETYQAEQSLRMLEFISSYYKRFQIKYAAEFSRLSADCVSLQLFADFILTFIKHTEFSSKNLLNWSEHESTTTSTTAELNCFLCVFNLLTAEVFKTHENPLQKLEWTKTLKEVFDIVLPSAQQKMEFLTNFYLYEQYTAVDLLNTNTHYTVLRLRAFKLTSAILRNQQHKLKLNTELIIKICIALSAKEDMLRLQALETLKDIAAHIKLEEHLEYLVTALLKRSAELSMDAEQYPLILFVILQTMKKKNQNMASKVLKEILLLLKQQAATTKLQNAVFQAELLKMLKHINDEHILSELLALASTALQQAVPNHATNNESINAETAMFILQKPYSDIYQLIIERFDMQTLANVLLQQPLAWQLLEQSFSQHQVFMISANKLQPVPCIVMETLNEHIYSSMPKQYQIKLVKLIIKTISQAQNDSIFLSANKLLKKCELNCEPLVELLENMSKTVNNKTKSAGQQRKSLGKRSAEQSNSKHNIATPAWKEGVVLLELLENKKKLNGSKHMIAALFELLRICLEVEEQTAVEYTKQLTLSALLHCCVKSKAAGIDLQQQLPKSTFRIDQIVQCMRATQNPLTHSNALLLLTHCAALFPQQVLHNIVDIFTFMGSSVVRHDDAYSFQIINNIIDSIIPILVQHQTHNNTEAHAEQVIPVLKVFSDIMLDVPEHRRLPLYTKLLQTLGTEQYLWSFLCVVFEAHVINDEKLRLQEKKNNNAGSQNAIEKTSQRLEIALQIANTFTPGIIFETCIQLMHYIKQLPMSKESTQQQQQATRKSLTPANATEFTLFDVKCRSAKQLRHYKYTIMQFLSNITSSSAFLRQIALLTPTAVLEMKPFYQNFIIKLLSYVPLVNNAIEKSEPEEISQIKFWKVLLHHLHDVLDNVISLLSADMFLVVVAGLMQHQLLSIRKKVIEVLINKLQQKDAFFDDCEQQNIYNLLKPLGDIINTILQRDEANSGIASPASSSGNELIFVQQSALIAIKLLSKLFALKYIEEFKTLLAQLTKIMKRRSNVSKIVLATVVLSTIEISSNLKAHSLAYLPKYMPQLIEVLQEQASILHQQAADNVCIALITGIQKLVESLPLFLGPYIVDIITALSTISNCVTAKHKENEKDQRSAMALHKLTAIWTRLANEVPARILVPSCEQAYGKLLTAQNYADIAVLMKLLATAISNAQTTELLGVQAELSDFFLRALEFRLNVQAHNYDAELIDNTEAIILEAFVSWILKLSEGSFRPLYAKVYEWALKRTAQRETILTFFLLTNKIAEALKSLFVLFASDFIEDAAKLLNENNSLHNAAKTLQTEALTISLIKAVLDTLFNVFLYDSKGFITAHRFDILMQPIVDQLENNLVLEQESVQQALTACIAQLAVTVSNDVLWKQLNYQVLLKTRSNIAEVRMLAFTNCVEIARKLGDDFTPLLPETVPFIAELFEDENPRVEKHTRKSVQNLESILGESIQKYL